MVAVTRNLAAEWGPHGIRVNAVGPAFFPTRLAGFLEDPDQVAWIEGHTALRRTARLEELDGAIVFWPATHRADHRPTSARRRRMVRLLTAGGNASQSPGLSDTPRIVVRRLRQPAFEGSPPTSRRRVTRTHARPMRARGGERP